MASKDKKLSENVPGRYYVDSDCIGCSACVAEAQENFNIFDDEPLAFVYKQPEGAREEKACSGAMASCPVNAIGDDGE